MAPRFRFLPDLQDPSDDPIFTVAGDAIYASFIPSAGNGGGMEISPTSLFSSTSTTTTASQSVSGSTVAVTSGGITINLLFDAAAMAAPASFRAGIQQAASILGAAIFDKITVNLQIDYSGTGGGAAAGPDNGLFESYSSIRADLINHATPGDTSFNALPSGSSIQGQSNVAVWNAQLKLWGLLGANDTTTDDGSATFATDINSNLLVGVALHELTHALGRIPYGSQPDIFDLFRFTSVGTRLFSGSATAPAAYFSLDGGHTKLADYGQTSDSSDFLNSGVQGPNDPFNEFYTSSTSQQLTAVDLKQMDVLGFHMAPPLATTVIEAFGLTSLVEVGSNYFLNSISGGTGPELKFGNGAPYAAGQAGTWSPIGAEQTSTGYEVAWKVAGADQYSAWGTDSNGTYLTNIIGVVSGTSGTLEALETSFHQDLNGDGVIGIPAATALMIEAFGSTSLVEAGSNYFLNSISSGTGPELKFADGTPFVAGQAGTWSPIGAEQTSTGYEVAWKVAGADQYSAWSTDSNGNYISNIIGVVSGTSITLESLETGLHQDLNGDGVIGVPGAVTIEAFGSTSLVEIGNNYYLDSNQQRAWPRTEIWRRRALCGRSGWHLVADRRRADVDRVRGCLEGRGRRSIFGLEYRQQRQLHFKYHRGCLRNQRSVGISGDQFPPGPERRRHDRCSRKNEPRRRQSKLDKSSQFDPDPRRRWNLRTRSCSLPERSSLGAAGTLISPPVPAAVAFLSRKGPFPVSPTTNY